MVQNTTGIVPAVNVDLQTNLLKNAKPLCPYFTGSTPAMVSQHAETFTAKWLDYANLTPATTPLTELADPLSFPTRPGSKITRTEITQQVRKYGDFQITTEELDLMAVTTQTAKFTEIFGIQAGRTLNILQRTELEDNGTLRRGNAVASDNLIITAIQKNDIDFVVNALLKAVAIPFEPMTTGTRDIGTAPILSSYWAFCHPDVAFDVQSLSGFKSVETYAGQANIVTAPGEFGYVQSSGVGVRFVQSPDAGVTADAGGTAATNSLRSTGGTNADLYNVPVFGRDYHGSLGFGETHIQESYVAGDPLPAVMMIANARGSSGISDALHELASIGWKSWHAAKILKPVWGYTIRVGAKTI